MGKPATQHRGKITQLETVRELRGALQGTPEQSTVLWPPSPMQQQQQQQAGLLPAIPPLYLVTGADPRADAAAAAAGAPPHNGLSPPPSAVAASAAERHRRAEQLQHPDQFSHSAAHAAMSADEQVAAAAAAADDDEGHPGGAIVTPFSAAVDAETVALIGASHVLVYPIGSFWSSVMANLLPRGVGAAIVARACPKVYIPNAGSDPEMAGHTIADCVALLLGQVRADAGATVSAGELRCSAAERRLRPDIHYVLAVYARVTAEILHFVLVDTTQIAYGAEVDVAEVSAPMHCRRCLFMSCCERQWGCPAPVGVQCKHRPAGGPDRWPHGARARARAQIEALGVRVLDMPLVAATAAGARCAASPPAAPQARRQAPQG
jgi:hypothetical protein